MLTGYFLQAFRSWRGAKAPAVVATLALAAGIGSTTAIFTIINGVLLQPVPYTGGARWISLLGGDTRDPKSRSSLPIPSLIQFQKRTQSFEVFGWLYFNNATLTAPGLPQHLETVGATANIVNALGVRPSMGEWFRASTNEPVAVIADKLWKRLGADAAFVGKTITLGGRSYTVIGVMPPGFRFPLASPGGDVHTDVWLPLDEQGRGADAMLPYFGMARRKPGVSLAAAEADVRRVAADLVKETPGANSDSTAHADGIVEIAVKEMRPTLLLLFGAAGILLLITCANVAGLMVARSVERARETAVRVALGATAGQLGRQYFFEGLLLALIGAAFGLALTPPLVKFAVTHAGQNFPGAAYIQVDWTVLGFTAAAACAASVLSSLAPLYQALRTAPNQVLTEGVRASSGSRSRNLTHALVVAEIALSFLLLACGAVLVNRLQTVQKTYPGFRPGQLITFQLTPSEEQFRHAPRRTALVRGILSAVESIPGIASAAVVNQVPLNGCCFVTPVYPTDRPSDFRVHKTSFLLVSPGYFATMGIAHRRGRLLTESDTEGDMMPVVINEQAAKLYWPGKDAVGATARVGAPDGSRVRVVGVVGDVRNNGLAAEVVPEVYFHQTASGMNPINVVARTPLPVSALARELARVVQSVDKDLPVHDLRALSEIVDESVLLERSSSWVTVFFAAAAVWMAALGIYGVVSYSARQRRVEIGTRMAFGAVRGDVVTMVLNSGWKLAIAGVIVGGAAYAACIPVLVRTLDVKETGVTPALFAAVVVTVVSLASSFFPAWRASLLSPLVAMRNDSTPLWDSIKGVRWQSAAEADAAPPASLLRGDFIQASRQAGSFRDALDAMLAILCTRCGARSAMLLERSAAGPFLCASTTGGSMPPLPVEGFLHGRLQFHSSALPIQAEDYQPLELWARQNRAAHRGELEALRRAEVRLAIPLRAGSGILGILLFGPPEKNGRYSAAMRAALDESTVQFALMLENARLADRVVEQEKMDRELSLAAEVQRRLLPQSVPQSDAASFAALSMPARSVGGDYYDFLRPGPLKIGLAIADVAGKGVAAALLTSMVQASLRLTAEQHGTDLALLVGRMNRFLKQTMGSNRGSFATFFFAVFDEASKELRYVNAGHNPPLFIRNGRVESLPRTGLVIGMFAKAEYQEARLALSSGDLLFVFTDGVTEARNMRGEEFGDGRLEAVLRLAASSPVDEISQRVSSELKSWMGEAPPHDDLTFVVMKVH